MIPPFFRQSVSIENRNLLPTRPGIYYLIQWVKPWKILYVGKAANLRSRWSGAGHHQLNAARKQIGVRIHYRVTWSQDRARELEAIEQRKYNPPWNDRIEPLFTSYFSNFINWIFCMALSIALYWGLSQYGNTSYTVNQLANFRERPTTQSKVICTIKKGTILDGQGLFDWKEFKACGTIGYLHDSNLLRNSRKADLGKERSWRTPRIGATGSASIVSIIFLLLPL